VRSRDELGDAAQRSLPVIGQDDGIGFFDPLREHGTEHVGAGVQRLFGVDP
jgi:hypothetical protein